MEEKELRELLQQRLHLELMCFKDSMLQQGKEDIFKASYRIEIYVNLYEILLVHTEKLQEDMIRAFGDWFWHTGSSLSGMAGQGGRFLCGT